MKQHRRHRISYITKRIIMIIALCCVMVSPEEIDKADAQVFIVTEEEFLNYGRISGYSGSAVPTPPQGDQIDWIYAPLGSGWLLLGGMAGAYLMAKRRKKRE